MGLHEGGDRHDPWGAWGWGEKVNQHDWVLEKKEGVCDLMYILWTDIWLAFPQFPENLSLFLWHVLAQESRASLIVTVWGWSVIFQVDLLPLQRQCVPYKGYYVTCKCGSVAGNILFLNTTLMQGSFCRSSLQDRGPFECRAAFQKTQRTGIFWDTALCPNLHLTFRNIIGQGWAVPFGIV